VSQGALILSFGAVVATMLAAVVRSIGAVGRRMAWIGYGMVVAGMLCVVALPALEAADAKDPAAAILGLAGLSFTLGILCLLFGNITANAQRRRESAPRPQRR
jgi:hypothetical protein